MRIALYSSRKPRCGIATYTNYLEKSLRDLKVDVRHWPSLVNDEGVFSEIRNWSADVFHVQYEQSIMPPQQTLFRFTTERAERGKKNVATLHSETQTSAEVVQRGAFHAAVIHRRPELLSGLHLLPMPCPTYVPYASRADLRRRYGFREDAFIVSTLGFLLPWKKTDEIVGHLLPWVAARPEVTLQVLASEHFNPDAAHYVRTCRENLARLATRVQGRIRHVAHYPSDEEVLDRLYLSDLGYVYCPFDTVSASAAASLFVSARCPLVVSDSTHYDHLIDYTVRAPKDSLNAFARVVSECAGNPELLERLRAVTERVYEDTNYLECARRHLRMYA